MLSAYTSIPGKGGQPFAWPLFFVSFLFGVRPCGDGKRKAHEMRQAYRRLLYNVIAINHLIIGDRVKFILFDGLDTS